MAFRFQSSQLVWTPGALRALASTQTQPANLLLRHFSGDWGKLDAEDIQANEEALIYGYRILSAYDLPNGEEVWVITEADRSVTTILLPEEY